MQGILATIKKMLGLPEDYEAFDQDVLVLINSTFLTLKQLGVGPSNGFSITGYDETWQDFIDDRSLLEAVKNYMYLKVRIIFDPPSSSYVLDAYKNQISEFEWRMNVDADGQTY